MDLIRDSLFEFSKKCFVDGDGQPKHAQIHVQQDSCHLNEDVGVAVVGDFPGQELHQFEEFLLTSVSEGDVHAFPLNQFFDQAQNDFGISAFEGGVQGHLILEFLQMVLVGLQPLLSLLFSLDEIFLVGHYFVLSSEEVLVVLGFGDDRRSELSEKLHLSIHLHLLLLNQFRLNQQTAVIESHRPVISTHVHV